MSLRVWVVCGLGALALPAGVWAQGGPADAARNWAEIAECAKIGQADARHDCMDGVARRAGVLSEARTAQAAREEFGREDRPVARRAPPPAPAAPAARAAAAPTRAEDIQELVTTITAVRTVGYRKLRVTTAEGSMWDQTQAEAFSSDPRVGDAFTIVRAPVGGGYRCQFRRASRYACERVD